MKCNTCGKETSDRNTYCSMQCARKSVWLSRKASFEQTGHWPGADSEVAIRRNCKKYLLETRGEVCSICSTREWLGSPVPLVLDHIDGDANNHAISNIRLVCGNCDMLLPTYKGRNRGKGRSKRRARYQEGLSY